LYEIEKDIDETFIWFSPETRTVSWPTQDNTHTGIYDIVVWATGGNLVASYEFTLEILPDIVTIETGQDS
jgi:hypothetical protein